MRTRYLIDLRRAGTRSSVGTKAEMLSLLQRYGAPIPPGFCCTFDAWHSFRHRDPELLSVLRKELASRIDPSASYAVRSSADVEDNLESSFAGQFSTLLEVQGLDEILTAITAVWDSAESESALAYARTMGRRNDPIRMGVIVQRMISPKFSGVAFSRNPITSLNEVVVEAVEGRGDALVQQGRTPARWVDKWGAWTVRPEVSAIPETLISEVVDGTRKIEKRYGKPVDLEWAHDGDRLLWLQMREISSLRNLNVFSEKMAREMIPGLIKPLIWSVNIPLVNGAWVSLLTELIGKNNLDPRSLARQFYYRAYFNMGAFGEIFALLGMPRESLELLMGIEVEGGEKPGFTPTMKTLRHLPRMIRFGWNKWTIHTEVERFVSEARQEYRPYQEQRVENLSPTEILAVIDRLFALNRRTAYYNIIVPLMMQMYHRAFKGLLGKLGVDYEQFSLAAGSREIQELDPNHALANARREYEGLGEEIRSRVRDATYAELERMEGVGRLMEEVAEFLRRFGHLSNIGVDFSSVPWRETPDLVLRMVTSFSPAPPDSGTKIRFEDLRVKGLRRWWARFLYERARRFMIYRAQVGDLYTMGYGFFRRFFLALADECVLRGVIAGHDDIFYLTHEELRTLVQEGFGRSGLAELAARRRAEMEEYRDVDVPETIYGDEAPPLRRQTSGTLRGIPTSRGYCRGPARVIRGLQEHENLSKGDVLVIPFSDVGLTPLFARAGAVVAESGGILSHSSIIAREYGIPAVVSVPNACRLKDGVMVEVDGFTGDVRVLDGQGGGK